MRPKAINLNKQQKYLEIVWDDDDVCRYPLAQLREACPCVECRGGHANMGRENDPKDLLTLELKPARSYEMTDLQFVGNYALQPTWSDTHHTGIYTWDYLKRLCPQKNADA
ncbi:MAG: DUF971 domain-containing protein [Chloroflexi bacterium]|nr:DUF971 domain-containing protein [Chloroflexota bacterium]